jgi:tellurium resistance protein TerD
MVSYFFNNLTSQGINHQGDNLTGEGEGDDEKIDVDLAALPSAVDELVIGANIFQAETRHQNFGRVNNAFVRLVNAADGKELMKYDLSEDQSTATGFILGKLYKKDGEWKFQAIGEPKTGDIFQIAGV